MFLRYPTTLPYIILAAGAINPGAINPCKMKSSNHKDTHVLLEGSERHHLAGAKIQGPADPHEYVEITVKLRGKTPLPEIDDRPKTILSHDVLTETYGSTPADVKAAGDALGIYGLKVFKTNPGARSLHLSGSVSQMETAFQVRLMNYTHVSGNYRGRTGYIHVPASLRGIVTAVFGLDSRKMISKKQPPTVNRDVNETLVVNRAWYFASELAEAYGFPEIGRASCRERV